jgi:hypothetical protein
VRIGVKRICRNEFVGNVHMIEKIGNCLRPIMPFVSISDSISNHLHLTENRIEVRLRFDLYCGLVSLVSFLSACRIEDVVNDFCYAS